MADPAPSSGTGDSDAEEAASGSVADFDVAREPEPEPTPGAPEPGPEDQEGGSGKRLRTTAALVAAVVVSMATILVARNILEGTGAAVSATETLLVGLIAVAVGVAAFIPYRWELWVVPFVALAHYGLNFYNMLFTEESVYQFVEASAMGYAVLTPAIGVVLGWVLEGLYQVIVPE